MKNVKEFINEMLKKLKEFWNENKKKIYSYLITFFAGVCITVIIVLSACNRRIDRANSEAATLGAELTEARAEVEKSRNTISELRRIQSELTGEIGSDYKDLHSVIERLTVIRDKVSDMENTLNNYYSDSHYNNNAVILQD